MNATFKLGDDTLATSSHSAKVLWGGRPRLRSAHRRPFARTDIQPKPTGNSAALWGRLVACGGFVTRLLTRRIYAGQIGFTPVLCIFVFLLAPPARAHDGPPFPIISDKILGPYKVSLWTHPDIGTGTFWVIVDPVDGKPLPKDLKVQVAVRPINNRIPERVFDAPPDTSSSQLQYKALVPFDRQEFVHARVHLESSQAKADDTATVEITPVGPQSRWTMLWYVSPFLGAGFLWFRAAAASRSRRKIHPRTRS